MKNKQTLISVVLAGLFFVAIAWILTIPQRNEAEYKREKDVADRIEEVRQANLRETNVIYCQTIAKDTAKSFLKTKVTLGMREYEEATEKDLFLTADYERYYQDCMRKYE